MLNLKNLEDIYILLFEPNAYDRNSSDDLIADAASQVGYEAPYHWHTEVAYFNKNNNQWMVMGCRPPVCSVDFPMDDLKKKFPGYVVNIRHLKIPVDKQITAREKFSKEFEGKYYKLAGPERTNCTDAAYRLGLAAEIAGITQIKSTDRQQLKDTGGDQLLRKYGVPYTTEQFMQRSDIIMPDEFEKIGEYVGSLQF